jgi:hypothetical protein
MLQGAQAFGELTLTVAGAHVLHHITLHTQLAGDAIAIGMELHHQDGRSEDEPDHEREEGSRYATHAPQR